ncbi:hypothetical protein SUGI_0805780 [Cryptomeria japonica]|nr:hypothetical protein SUGI_0805780 [Cryptomeria japonica]
MAPWLGPWRPVRDHGTLRGPWCPGGTRAPHRDHGALGGPWRPVWGPGQPSGPANNHRKVKMRKIKSQMFSQLTSSSGSSSITAWRRISTLVGRFDRHEGMMMAMWAPLQ